MALMAGKRRGAHATESFGTLGKAQGLHRSRLLDTDFRSRLHSDAESDASGLAVFRDIAKKEAWLWVVAAEEVAAGAIRTAEGSRRRKRRWAG